MRSQLVNPHRRQDQKAPVDHHLVDIRPARITTPAYGRIAGLQLPAGRPEAETTQDAAAGGLIQ